MHALNDTPGILAQLYYALKPGGSILGVIYGGESLKELKKACMQAEIKMQIGISPHVIPFMDIKQLGMLLQRVGFVEPIVNQEKIILQYQTLGKLYQDLKNLGETNYLAVRRKGLSTPKYLQSMESYYVKGRKATYPVTVNLLYTR